MPDNRIEGDAPRWQQPMSNVCLDFHGDPATANLVIFSDGNHHMALWDALKEFQKENPNSRVFYATTPPSPIVQLLKNGQLQIGNLTLSVRPHLFISPPHILDALVDVGYMPEHLPFMKNQGNVLLVAKGNPKHITGIHDLIREDVQLFISNPETESASYQAYMNTLTAMAELRIISLENAKFLYGENIHHREAPETIYNGHADVAIVYYHLALRYKRIFPDLFDVVPLGGTVDHPQPVSGNEISLTHIGLIGDGGEYGQSALQFLKSNTVRDIYAQHGLLGII